MNFHQNLQDIKEDQLSLASIHYMRSHYQEAIDIYKRILLDNRSVLFPALIEISAVLLVSFVFNLVKNLVSSGPSTIQGSFVANLTRLKTPWILFISDCLHPFSFVAFIFNFTILCVCVFRLQVCSPNVCLVSAEALHVTVCYHVGAEN